MQASTTAADGRPRGGQTDWLWLVLGAGLSSVAAYGVATGLVIATTHSNAGPTAAALDEGFAVVVGGSFGVAVGACVTAAMVRSGSRSLTGFAAGVVGYLVLVPFVALGESSDLRYSERITFALLLTLGAAIPAGLGARVGASLRSRNRWALAMAIGCVLVAIVCVVSVALSGRSDNNGASLVRPPTEDASAQKAAVAMVKVMLESGPRAGAAMPHDGWPQLMKLGRKLRRLGLTLRPGVKEVDRYNYTFEFRLGGSATAILRVLVGRNASDEWVAYAYGYRRTDLPVIVHEVPTAIVYFAASGPGTVVASRAKDDQGCGQGCLLYVPGTQVALHASPTSGAHFVRWTGSCAGRGTTCRLTLRRGRPVTAQAVFAR